MSTRSQTPNEKTQRMKEMRKKEMKEKRENEKMQRRKELQEKRENERKMKQIKENEKKTKQMRENEETKPHSIIGNPFLYIPELTKENIPSLHLDPENLTTLYKNKKIWYQPVGEKSIFTKSYAENKKFIVFRNFIRNHNKEFNTISYDDITNIQFLDYCRLYENLEYFGCENIPPKQHHEAIKEIRLNQKLLIEKTKKLFRFEKKYKKLLNETPKESKDEYELKIEAIPKYNFIFYL